MYKTDVFISAEEIKEIPFEEGRAKVWQNIL